MGVNDNARTLLKPWCERALKVSMIPVYSEKVGQR